MHSFVYLFFLWAVLLAPFASQAQHTLFAVSGQGRGSPSDARQAAEISGLQNEINKRDACQSGGLLFSPGHADADSDGCIQPGTGVAGVPTGAVLAFNLASCPSGWSALASAEGRVILGAGSLGGDAYGLGDTGGAARHTLTVDEMPRHNHQAIRLRVHSADNGVDNECCFARGATTTDPTSFTGGDQPHENRPPYLALLYCQKD